MFIDRVGELTYSIFVCGQIIAADRIFQEDTYEKYRFPEEFEGV